MAYIRLVMQLWEEGPSDGCPDSLPASRVVHVDSMEVAEQISREMHSHFDQVSAENLAARAVADALAHPEAQEPKISGLAMTSQSSSFILREWLPWVSR